MKRLIEEGGSRLEVDLLRAAQVENPPDGAARRTLVALGVGGAVLSGSSAVASAATGAAKVTLPVLAKWIGIGMVGGVVVVGAVHGVAVYPSPAPPPPVAAAVAERSPRPAALPAAAHTAQNDVAPVVEAPAIESLPAARAAEPPRSNVEPHAGAPAAPAAGAASLAPEIAMIDAARRAVASNDPNDALAVLDRYANEFPRGRFVPEATYLRIQALVQRGDRAAAAALGRRYLASMPDGPHAKQVRAMLAGSGETIP